MISEKVSVVSAGKAEKNTFLFSRHSKISWKYNKGAYHHYSVIKLCPTLCDPVDCSMPGFLVFQYFPEFAQTHVHWFNGTIQPSHSLLPPSPPSFSLSLHQSFSSESALCIRWPEYWSYSFCISPSNEYSGLVSLVLLVWSPCRAWDSQEFFPALQFGSLSLVLSILYEPALTSVHDYWKNHSFDYMDLCWQSENTTGVFIMIWRKIQLYNIRRMDSGRINRRCPWLREDVF